MVLPSTDSADTNKAESIDELIARFKVEGNGQINASCDPIDPFSAEDWNRWTEVEQQEVLMIYLMVGKQIDIVMVH